MPDESTPAPNLGPMTDPYEAIERAQDEDIARPEQPPMDDASGLPEEKDDESDHG